MANYGKTDHNDQFISINHNHPGDKDTHKEEAMLPQRQEQALEMMLDGISDSDIAQKLGVTRQTVNYWRNQDKDFRLNLRMRRLQIWETHIDQIAKLYPEAIKLMSMGLKSKNQHVRLRAAIQILRMPVLQEILKNKERLDPERLQNERLGEGVKEFLANIARDFESDASKIKRGSDKTIGGSCSKPPTQV